MLEIAIIEDEPIAAAGLEKALNEVRNDVNVVAKLNSVQSAIQWLQHNQVDLILSDIELGDGLSFEVFRQLKSNIPIIITTAYDKYAIRAFKENSIDYLLKPIDLSELKTALDKYESWHGSGKLFNMDSLLEALKPSTEPSFQERFIVTLGDRIQSIPEEEVAYFFSEDRYTYLVARAGKQHIINSNLGELELSLSPRKFFRINRKFIVSYDCIRNMVAYSKSRVKLELEPSPPTSAEVVVSVERSGPFKKWLNR